MPPRHHDTPPTLVTLLSCCYYICEFEGDEEQMKTLNYAEHRAKF